MRAFKKSGDFAAKLKIDAAAASDCGKPPAPFEIQVPPLKAAKFTGKELPDVFAAGAGAKLSVAAVSRSDTGASLRFEWEKSGASFTWTKSEAFTHITGENPDPCVYEWITFTRLSTFSVWIYNETPLKDSLWFEIGTKDRTDCRFYMYLDFTGWRELAAMYGRDIRKVPRNGADTLRVIAPASVGRGSLCVDLLNPRDERDVRIVKSTFETPWVKNRKAAVAGGGSCVEVLEDAIAAKTALGSSGNLNSGGTSPVDPPVITEVPLERVSIPVPGNLDDFQRNALRVLTDSYMKMFNVYASVDGRECEVKDLVALRERFAKHQFSRNGNIVSGLVIHPRTIWPLINELATAMTASSPGAAKDELRRMAFELIDLVIQYGHTAWYGENNRFVRPLHLLHEDLKATARWEPIISRMKQIYGVDRFDIKDIYGNADDFNCELLGKLGAVLQQEDSSLKWRDMVAFQRYFTLACEYGAIKPDGSFFHHNMPYTGYTMPAIHPICTVVRLLRG
ncbi:MAG: chondroitinase family protein, partial [Lentisphaerota bacterium]